MLKTLLIFLISGICLSTFANGKGYLVVGNDTTHYDLKFQERGNNTKVFFKQSYESDYHEVYAENADAAAVPGRELFLSLKLPDTSKKVWVRCFFDGTYKLVRYNSQYYLVQPSGIMELKAPGDGHSESIFKGQMILLFSSKISYDFDKLNYTSESLVVPLIKYHEKENWHYTDYNKYINSSVSIMMNANFSTNKVRLAIDATGTSDFVGNSFGIGVARTVSYPDFSKKLGFSLGVKFDAYLLNQYIKNQQGAMKGFIDLNYKPFSVGAQGQISYQLIDSKMLKAVLGAGVEGSRMFAPSSQVKVETMTENVVQTAMHGISVNDKVSIFQVDQLRISCPKLTHSFQIGIAKYFLLNERKVENYVLVIDRSFQFSLSYIF